MRILCWSQFFYPNLGGVETLLMNLLPALRDRGHEVLAVASHGAGTPDEAVFQGVRVRRFDFRHALVRRDPRELIGIRREVAALKRTFAPDLVHVHFAGPTTYFHATTRDATAAPTLLTMHGPTGSARAEAGTLFGEVLEDAAWVTAVSRATLADLVGARPDLAPRASLIYNGLPAPVLAPTALDFEEPHLLCIGRMVPEKGFDLAIAALPLIARRWPRCRLTLCGEGSARADLERQALSLGLGERVQFTGWIHPGEVHAVINRATVVLAPARWSEPFCLVAVEAAQMGRPVIATAVGGLTETVVDGETGLLVPPDDAAAVAEAVLALLDDPRRATAWGAAGRARAAEQFGFESCVGAYDRLYRQLVPGSSSAERAASR
jgi:glycogen(starch) synthase